MKRFLCILLGFVLLFSFCGCTTNVSGSQKVKLTFQCGEENIQAVLNDEEAARVITILDGKAYSSVFDGIPSCGFDSGISLTVGSRVFAIARDTCNCIQDLGNLRYFDISYEDMGYIHSLFEKYGGYFPCV